MAAHATGFFCAVRLERNLGLGGVNPLPFDLPDGGPGTALLIVLAHDTAYLVDRAALGGIGHPLVVQQVAEREMLPRPPSIALDTTCWSHFGLTARIVPANRKLRAVGAAHFSRATSDDAHAMVRRVRRTRVPDRHHERRYG